MANNKCHLKEEYFKSSDESVLDILTNAYMVLNKIVSLVANCDFNSYLIVIQCWSFLILEEVGVIFSE